MNLDKKAQNIDGFKISPDELEQFLNKDISDLRMVEEVEEIEEDNPRLYENILSPETENPDIVLEDESSEKVIVEPLEEKNEFDPKLDNIPGAEAQDEIEIPEEEIVEDPWRWTHDNIFEWCQNRKENIPKHSGHDIAGLERVISYLERWLGELSKVARTDHDGIVDIKKLEDVRNELINGIERCKDRLDKLTLIKGKKKKKKADENYELIKEATKTGRFSVTVDLLISSIVRTCINSTVSAGHDLTKTLTKLAKEYNLDKREKLQVVQLLADMGWATYLDRGTLEKELDITSPNNFDWLANYPG